MKLLKILPLTLLSLSAFAKGPDCKGLGDIISNIEADLQRSTLKDCQKVEYKDSFASGATLDTAAQIHFEEARCQPLAKVEMDIARLEGQLTTLRALQEFSKDLAVKNDVLKTVPTDKKLDETVAAQGKNFQTGVKTAFVFESLLQAKKPDFLNALKARTKNGDLTKTDLEAIINSECPKAEYCTEIQPYTKLLMDDPAILKDIGNAIKNSPLDSKSIDAMKAALKIEQKDEKGNPITYSDIIDMLEDGDGIDFSKMTANSPMNKNLIKAIKKVPSFKASGDLSFMKSLSEAKNAIETKSIIEKFKYASEDVSLRNEITMKSKMSAIMFKLDQGKQLPDETKTACADLFNTTTSSEACLASLEKSSASLSNVYEYEKMAIIDIRALAKSNQDIKDFESRCLNEQALINNSQLTTGANPLKDCNQSFISEETILSKKLSGLNTLREKMLSKQKKAQDFRNFAIQKVKSNTCDGATFSDSIIGDCGMNVENINPAVKLLSGDILKVAVAYTPFTDVDISEYCDDDDVKKDNYMGRLCEYLDGEGLPNRGIATSSNDNASAPTDVDSRAGHDAKMNALQGAINNIASALGQQNRNTYVPYNYYNPYASTTPPMTISDTLTYNSMYYGGYSGYYPMANSSPFVYNSQLFGYMGKATNTGSLYSYSATGTSTSSYGISSFLPTFGF